MSDWDIELSHVRATVRRRFDGTVRTAQLQQWYPGMGAWDDMVYQTPIYATKKPELRQKMEDLNAQVQREINASQVAKAVRERKRIERERIRTEARRVYRGWVETKYAHLADAYRESPNRHSGRPTSHGVRFCRWVELHLARIGCEAEVERIREKKEAIREEFGLGSRVFLTGP